VIFNMSSSSIIWIRLPDRAQFSKSINRFPKPQHPIPSHQPINTLTQPQNTRRSASRMPDIMRVVRNQHQPGLLDRSDERGDQFQQARCADQAHEVIGLGDADGFFEGHVGATAAGYLVCLEVCLVGGGFRGGDAEFVAEEDGVCWMLACAL